MPSSTTHYGAHLREVSYAAPGYDTPRQNVYYDENTGEPWTMYVVPTCRRCMWEGPRVYVGARLHVGDAQDAWARANEMLDAHIHGRPIRPKTAPHGRFYL